MVPPLYLGVGTTPGPGTTAPWDHAWSSSVLAHDGPAHAAPARSDGVEGKGHTAALRADRGR